jgi:indole-3-glycerol phosphate synthase
MNFLETILSHKREEVAGRKKSILRAQLESMPKFDYERKSLYKALRESDPAIIAEIKKASPSKNVIREEFNPIAIAREFVRAGATALSVLTDQKFFQGDIRYIERMRDFVSLPIVRKDFILEPYQLYETRACGADAVLLIAAILQRNELLDLAAEATSLGLEVIAEVHNEDEIENVESGDVHIIGINNRDLETFETDITTSMRLRKYIPSDKVIISESGLTSRKEIDQLRDHGIHAFLIGEQLMRAESPGRALQSLLEVSDEREG